MENRVICENPDSPFCYFGWPSIARLPGGALAVSASGFRLHHVCPFGKAVMCYSFDEGKSWTAPAAVIDTPLDDRDAGLTVCKDGTVILTSFNNCAAYQHKSNTERIRDKDYMMISAYLSAFMDEKAEERFLGSVYKVSKDGGFTFGEVKKAPVTSPHGMCVCPGGRVLYIGRTFQEDDRVRGEDEDRLECWEWKDGKFSFLSAVPQVYLDGKRLLSCEPFALALTDRNILLHIRIQREGQFTIYQSESENGGYSWTQPHPVGLIHGSPPHLLRHSSGVLVGVYGRRIPPYGQRAMFSSDEGKTWNTEYVLRDDGPSGDLGYPCSVELQDGRILTVYYQQKEKDGPCVIMQSVWDLPQIR